MPYLADSLKTFSRVHIEINYEITRYYDGMVYEANNGKFSFASAQCRLSDETKEFFTKLGYKVEDKYSTTIISWDEPTDIIVENKILYSSFLTASEMNKLSEDPVHKQILFAATYGFKELDVPRKYLDELTIDILKQDGYTLVEHRNSYIIKW